MLEKECACVTVVGSFVLQQEWSKGYTFLTTAEHGTVHDVREKLCYVAIDYNEKMKKVKGLVD